MLLLLTLTSFQLRLVTLSQNKTVSPKGGTVFVLSRKIRIRTLGLMNAPQVRVPEGRAAGLDPSAPAKRKEASPRLVQSVMLCYTEVNKTAGREALR